MHKLAKGLKKKKKQKKGKKGQEEEEFDPEELERYRRERAEAQQKLEAEAAAAAESAAAAEGSGSDAEAAPKKKPAENDEWKKFQALTSGIDTILKKTQDDLDRIKSTSFYQRKEKEPEPDPEEDPEVQRRKQELAKRYAGFDEHGNPIELKDDEEEKSKALPLPVTEDGFVEVPDDDEDGHEDDLDEDIFDTTYVDVIQNVEVQLAYIPDSPTEEELGDDPFDTSSADKVLKIVDKTGRKLVSLGNAAEVLAGRIDHVSSCKIGRNRPRQTQDLLLADFDAEVPAVQIDEAAASEPVEVEKTLLDDDSDLPDVDLPPVDLTKLPPILTRPVTPANPEDGGLVLNDELLNKPLDISEFELLKDKTLLDDVPTLDDEEFDLDAPAEPIVLEEADDPFAEKEPEVDVPEEIVEVAFEAATFVNEDDPFDTTIADNLVPGKAELKFIEKELDEVQSEVSISVTDPRGLRRDYVSDFVKSSQPQSSSSLSAAKKDLLGGSSTDLSQLADKPIEPVEQEISYVDPFDTSNIQDLPPGKTELKFIEQELLGQDKQQGLDALDDDDFDPRAGEPVQTVVAEKPKPARPPPISPITVQPTVKVEEPAPASLGRKPSRPEALDISAKIVAFELPSPSNKPDLLATGGDEEKALPGKPLTPYYPQKSIEEVLPAEDELEEAAAADPFDTSFVPNTAPGKTELKIIESELLQEDSNDKVDGLTRSVSEHDFDPRGEASNPPVSQNRRQSDFGPVVKSSEVIESLINKRKALNKRQDSILDSAVEASAVPLAPNVKPNTIEEEIELAYKDPFDTSHATNILPGKAELKLLEDELSQVQEPAPVLRPHPVIEQAAKKAAVEEDPDFDPRAEEAEQHKDILCLDAQEDVPAGKVLTPIQDADLPDADVDPFDTSFASIGPGKTELKLLESELISK